MKVKDKSSGKMVDVSEKDCPTLKCYWPRPDPGVFTQGVGYRQISIKVGWLCGTREARGCPDGVAHNAEVSAHDRLR
jgi:hypothetical protein